MLSFESVLGSWNLFFTGPQVLALATFKKDLATGSRLLGSIFINFFYQLRL